MAANYVDATGLHIADPHTVEGVDGGSRWGDGGGGDGRGRAADLYAKGGGRLGLVGL